jgi:hypothetical protein
MVTEVTVVADQQTAEAALDTEAATLAIELHDRGVVGLSKFEVAREAARMDISPRILAMYLHDADIDIHPWET